MRQFYAAFMVAAFALCIGAGLGYWQTASLTGVLMGVEAVAILALMETAESMDNAIVDYGILKTMSPQWQRRYMSWGMPISVLGMRFLFPILLVAIVAGLSPWQAARLAVMEPQRYAHIMLGARDMIASFGGAFLLLIALNYFLDDDKTHHWVTWVEKPVARLGGVPALPVGVTLAVLMGVSRLMGPGHDPLAFLFWGCGGIVAYILGKEGLVWLIGEPGAAPLMMKGGLLSFLYLEFIDASFSFDGVISAFAITTDPITIALGLGVGAMFVRSMTLSMLKTNALAEYVYVEHGAFYTILILSLLMLCGVLVSVPEWITGLVGLLLIGGAFLASIAQRRSG
ncbi:DUF475 domain-containing protein [Bombella saccharophila]|uniref:DUF475 domain-containing protein n=1 Tax=Bombella saccharophila TaxID=2967338 RepID=A0ABT3W4P0_9PROT|nr:DUF475 domain-containing protein [Bombella saccharophila]MCX5614019.1 DUF475 domain-containing protein [Bombella saccharophila]